MSWISKAITLMLCLGLTAACAPSRPPVPPGTIPLALDVSAADEQYGQEVLGELTQQYPLDRDDARINRVRDIVDRLALAAKADKKPWNVFVLKDDQVKNAAATRGNYIFVWTGMLMVVKDDHELATILAHEMGHVLAGHTADTPEEEASRIMSSVLGSAARAVVEQTGEYSVLAPLAEAVVTAVAEAIFINPYAQGNELEADQIGLFLMSDAKYDPQKAVDFWERVKNDPDFGGTNLAFLSSHPSSEERVDQLKIYLPQAISRYKSAARGNSSSNVSSPSKSPNKKTPQPKSPRVESIDGPSVPVTPIDAPASSQPADSSTNGNIQSFSAKTESWIVSEQEVLIRANPESNAETVGKLSKGNVVVGTKVNRGRWLKISQPVEGYIRTSSLSPQ